MDIAKIKAFVPTIDVQKLKQTIGPRLNPVIEKLKTTDIKSLFIGLSVFTLIYVLLFLYVHINRKATITQLESQLASETVSVQHVESDEMRAVRISSTGSMPIIGGLHKVTPIGKLPVIREDNLTSFRAYQHPFSFKNITKPVISFILIDYGLSEEQSETALDILPSEVSFVLSSYSTLPGEWMEMAQEKGHEVIISMPIQNKTATDSGKHTIFHHSPLSIKQDNMHNSLTQTQGYIGVGSHTDNSSNVAKDHYLSLVDEIYSRGLGIFELNPDAPIFMQQRALAKNTPYVKADLKIFKIKGKHNSFETLETIAKEKGHAVAIIPSYPSTIKHLAAWIMKVAQADYTLVPASAIYDLPLHRSKSAAATKVIRHKPTTLQASDHIEPKEKKPDHHAPSTQNNLH